VTFPLARFLNQTASYQAFASVNNRDDVTYAAAVNVACRFVEVDRERHAKDEDVRQSKSKVWLSFQPPLRSLINGREVIQTTAMVPVSGEIPGYVAMLR
jgi:hypothetical protein